MTMDWSSLYTLTKLAYKTHSHEETFTYTSELYLERQKKCKYTISFLLFLSFSCFEDLFNIFSLSKKAVPNTIEMFQHLQLLKEKWRKLLLFKFVVSINCWDQVSVTDKNLHQHFTHPSTLHRLLFPLLHSRRSFLNYSRSSSLSVPRDAVQYQRSWKTLMNIFAPGWTRVSEQAQNWEGRKRFHASVDPDRSSSTFDSVVHDSCTITLHHINTITVHTSL